MIDGFPNTKLDDCLLINGDCLEVMDKLIENNIKVDLTITSPPYDSLRTYNNKSNWNENIWKQVIEKLYILTKDGGVVVWIIGDETKNFCESLSSFKQALYFKEIGFNVLDTMIYHKSNYAPAYPTLKRYANTFEYMFIMSKGKPNTFNPIQTEKATLSTKQRLGKYRKQNGEFVIKNMKVDTGRTTKDAENVWTICPTKSKDAGNHPAVFPEQLANDHILSWSNPNDLVLDCFMGANTTGKMAKINNRKFIGIEIDESYYNIVIDRITNNRKREENNDQK